MIKYALICELEHEFEGWFSSSSAYDEQAGAGLVECPECGTSQVRKALMAPAVKTSRSREGADSMEKMAAKVRAHIRRNYDYVGEDFADEARAIHEGDKPERLIYGETTPEQSKALKEEGVPVSPLPDELAPTPRKKAH
jgi:hypothetical protein